MMDYILIPSIFQKIAQRVDVAMSTRTVDPFHTYFDYGHYAEVVRNLKEKDGSINAKNSKYPLIWLVMDFVEKCGDVQDSYCLLPDLQLLIASGTSIEETTASRIENNFKNRLIPVYREFMSQLAASGFFFNIDADYVPHERILRPYWGGQETGNGTANLFNDFIDCIQIRKLRLRVNENVCNQFNL